MEFITELFDWMRVLPQWGLLGFLAASVVIENIFQPWPGDVIIVFIGLLVGQGIVSIWSALFATFLGNLVGSLTMYFLGLRLIRFFQQLRVELTGEQFAHGIFDFVSQERVDRAQQWVKKGGLALVFISRFLTGVRFFISVVAGGYRMNLSLFVIAFSTGALLWSYLLLKMGMVVGRHWDQVELWLSYYNRTVLAILFGLAAIYGGWKWFKSIRIKRIDS